MSFRNIDVDKFDEDQYGEDEILAEFETGVSPEEHSSAVQNRNGEVRSLMAKGNTTQALAVALENPPYGRNLQAIKATNTKTVMEVLSQFRVTDIPAAVKSLNLDQQDVLMKYIYAGLQAPDAYNSAVLLSWHEKLTEVAGTGCIVRVMTDKRTVW